MSEVRTPDPTLDSIEPDTMSSHIDKGSAIDLVVAASAGGVLSTGTPLPTDGLPEWWRHPNEQRRQWSHVHEEECDRFGCVPDGPFPVTVGIWEEVRWCSFCDGFECEDADHYPHWSTVGAIVSMVLVSGPSHQADECYLTPAVSGSRTQPHCHPDAATDGWHTPVASVHILDVPIPCERPLLATVQSTTEARVFRPADWWVPRLQAADVWPTEATMTAHTCKVPTPGCFRCELNADELADHLTPDCTCSTREVDGRDGELIHALGCPALGGPEEVGRLGARASVPQRGEAHDVRG